MVLKPFWIVIGVADRAFGDSLQSDLRSLRQQGYHALHHQQAVFEHAALQHEQAVRDQTQAAIERALISNKMRWRRSFLESKRLLNKRIRTSHANSHMSRVAERLVGKQKSNHITEAIQALQMRDEGAAQQIQARDEATQKLNSQIYLFAGNSN